MSQDKETKQFKALIDENLKRVYQDALSEEIPDRFKQLLEKLREKEAEK